MLLMPILGVVAGAHGHRPGPGRGLGLGRGRDHCRHRLGCAPRAVATCTPAAFRTAKCGAGGRVRAACHAYMEGRRRCHSFRARSVPRALLIPIR